MPGETEFEIAALKAKQTAAWNPMAPGAGTPWEDRATHGVVGAFLKTCIASMTRPRQLVDLIRRPETATDARAFVIGCGICWGLSAAGHLAYGLHVRAKSPDFIGTDQLWVAIYLLVALVGGTIGIVMLWNLYTAIYNRLLQEETRRGTALPEPLLHTAAGYGFGPSILAVIPVVGPVLALVGMFLVLVVIGTSRRLRLRFAAALIDAVLGFLAIAVVGGAATFVSLYANKVVPDAVQLRDAAEKAAAEQAVH